MSPVIVVNMRLLLFSGKVLFSSFATPWTTARQAPLSLGLPRQELEWAAISPRQSPLPRDQTRISCPAGRSFTMEPS